jgi:hypothetical protein
VVRTGDEAVHTDRNRAGFGIEVVASSRRQQWAHDPQQVIKPRSMRGKTGHKPGKQPATQGVALGGKSRDTNGSTT